jgi:hypothetical protein
MSLVCPTQPLVVLAEWLNDSFLRFGLVMSITTFKHSPAARTLAKAAKGVDGLVFVIAAPSTR